ncbi:STAS domain-containing protein [Rhodoblastus acidophilus]|uniref:STAS domain-containing protein n=1 Tax=Candidatus Rhodoblastus alkanivorans TaxID=2954117 RepID=A0ABS9Z511_9HYPH|nr:SulP family inorganic anion transporter [Candidatus Rhodoblastus alkanivorans]MCI4682768.1 STAS domain-containing protein [Candidatus Rhodoblastus alkanivorans]MDI4640075.1 STAS domain-containing protein [Rhodoblastus acidophilus]
MPLKRREALKDAFAGLTLASMNAPQVLGYTRIAGTPVVTGLYTVLLPLVGFALFGSSRHLVVAADSATAAIFSSSLSRMAPAASEKYMALVGMLTLLTALLLLLARIFKLGFLADFLSRTALVGFLTGVGIQVGVAMLPDMLGVKAESHRTLVQFWDVLLGLPRLNQFDLGLSVLVVGAILLGKRFTPHFPVAMIVVLGMIAASAGFDFASHGVALIGPVPGGLPSLRWPDVSLQETLALLPVAGSCFVMIIAQSAATSRVYALRHKERVDENADILGLAAANAGAALTGAFVVNGSPTQTAMADNAGARSQVAQLTFAAIVAVVLVALTGPLQYLPHCVLASIVFTIAVGMVDIKGLKAILKEDAGEFRLAALTAAAVPGIGVEQGILLAIALSLVRHVRHSYRPQISILAPNALGRWEPTRARPGLQTAPGLIVYRFAADLFYANVDRFADEARDLIAAAPSPIRHFVIDAGALTDIDFSAARSLRDLLAELATKNVEVVMGRVSADLRNDLDRHGIVEALGADRIFSTLHQALTAVGIDPNAMERANTRP